jgi:hypothetical protein
VRQWLFAAVMGFVACGRADAASVNADLAVSVTVVDQCLLHSGTASASCTGGTVYALGVGRERVPVAKSDVLTTADEHAHTSRNGPLDPFFQAVAGGAAGSGGLGFAPDAVRTVAATSTPVESIRVTYSF